MPRGPCSPETASLLPAGQRPRGCRSTRPGGGAWPHRSVDVTAARRPAGCFSSSLLCPGPRPGRARASRPLLPDSTEPGPAAGPNPAQPAASPRPYCARACGRAEPGPVGRSSTTPLCPGPPPGRTRPSRPFRLAPTVPGPAANPISAQSASPPRSHCARAHGRTDPARAVHHPGRRAGPGRATPPTGSHSGRWSHSDRQVRGTDSDTSWRRRGRRSWTAPPACGTCGPGPDDSAW